MERALVALEGLSVGDAFGECFFVSPEFVEQRLDARVLPPAPWTYTDDTEMATAIVDVLDAHGRIDQDALARAFAQRFVREPNRGYGGGAHRLLRALGQGASWRVETLASFGGMGSFGNGGAMRAAPVGAYFADDLDAVVTQAALSAEVTHAHPDGQAGAIATALAAAYAHRFRVDRAALGTTGLLDFVMARTPSSATREMLERAARIEPSRPVEVAMWSLGSGAKITSADTVPFALWCAAKHLGDYEEALWTTVSGLGDRDTTCAIAGGIVALSCDDRGIPEAWLAAREVPRRDRGDR
ncbi:N-formylglutamate deformylase [Minicystis rosea]|nr:N-formylglutamate deformylase [Minicystis rosea]